MRASTAKAYVARVFRRYGARPPKVKVKRLPAGHGWAGRFVPERHEIHLHMSRSMSEEQQRALLVHETAHGLARVVERRRKAASDRKLTYHGQHDRHFYGVLRQLHKRSGVRPQTSLSLERKSGYAPPRSWRRAVRLGKW